MSFVPSKLLLWIVALVVVPAWLVLGMSGAPIEILVLAGVVFVGLAALDAVTSLQVLNGVEVQIPPEICRRSGPPSIQNQNRIAAAADFGRSLAGGIRGFAS
jgi:hypothetical protein